MKRPGLNNFLKAVSKLYEVVIFTASMQNYANPLLDILDPTKKLASRLFREHAFQSANGYIKDISCLGRKLSDVIIIDNSPVSYSLQPENALPISSWYFDDSDNELSKLLPLLEFLAEESDVRKIIPLFVNNQQINYSVANTIIEQNNKIKSSTRMKSMLEKEESCPDLTKSQIKGTSTFNLRLPSATKKESNVVQYTQYKGNGVKKIGINLLDMYKKTNNFMFSTEKQVENRSSSLLSKITPVDPNLKHSFLSDEFNSTIDLKKKKGESIIQKIKDTTLQSKAMITLGTPSKASYHSKVDKCWETDILKEKLNINSPSKAMLFTFDAKPSKAYGVKTYCDDNAIKEQLNINSPTQCNRNAFTRAHAISSVKTKQYDDGNCITRLLEKIKRIELSIK